MTNDDKTLVGVHLSPKEHRLLKRIAKAEHRSIAAVLRILIEEKFKQYKESRDAGESSTGTQR